MSKRIYPRPDIACRYEIQEIYDPGALNTAYRITDTRGDNRISTSYDLNNAKLVCDALNEKEENRQKPVTTLDHVQNEIDRAKSKYPKDFNSTHEGYAVLLEEVDELWDEVKKNQRDYDYDKMRTEAIQIAAMAVRFANELCK